MIELALGLYFTATLFYALANGIYGTVPFLMLFQVGFLYTGMLSLLQQHRAETRWSKSRRAKKPRAGGELVEGGRNRGRRYPKMRAVPRDAGHPGSPALAAIRVGDPEALRQGGGDDTARLAWTGTTNQSASTV